MVKRAKLSLLGSLASPMAIGALIVACLAPACAAPELPATTGHKAKAASGADPETGTLGGSRPADNTGTTAATTGAVDVTPACGRAVEPKALE